jgi:hypothetical protein
MRKMIESFWRKPDHLDFDRELVNASIRLEKHNKKDQPLYREILQRTTALLTRIESIQKDIARRSDDPAWVDVVLSEASSILKILKLTQLIPRDSIVSLDQEITSLNRSLRSSGQGRASGFTERTIGSCTFYEQAEREYFANRGNTTPLDASETMHYLASYTTIFTRISLLVSSSLF